MKFTVSTYFTDEKGNVYKLGDKVSLSFHNGSGMVGCRITKINKTGFHCMQEGKDKSIQFEKIAELY